MTDDLPFDYPSPPTRTGAVGRKPCRRHSWREDMEREGILPQYRCHNCAILRDPAASRRGRNNGKRGRRAELDVARSIPGGRKMGPLGLPWDVEVGEYARLQVKKLARRPGPAEVVRLIDKIPPTGDRLRGFVWVEAAGRGKRGQRIVWFLEPDWQFWHGPRRQGVSRLVSMPLAEWIAECVP